MFRFPPFPGEPNDETLRETQREQPQVGAETVEENEKEQPLVEVELNQQEPPNEPMQRPHRASSLWFWHEK
ncbi:hypothetical protein CPAR01_09495 [Colletotrichum paranaense]|uniref:Uncharacterized protein n=1 Tax=Colletotrichum paranaense TaxID=1914294 RepID=A0ABQ9SGX3_9PEZI|nr:uncharacterized protein CPAR01_09495 [Colletotrichum paranaense]KAK1535953.1 hypothetical protein CPAR01_09495 [Colletotrichum paranaense]